MHRLTLRPWQWGLSLLILLSFTTALLLPKAGLQAVEEPELLEQEVAFALQAEAVADAMTLRFQWTIAEGYYLYREAFRFTPQTPGWVLGEPRMPTGTVVEDDFFGRVETYRHSVVVEVPVLQASGNDLEVTTRSQGCADLGVCYPPHLQTLRLSLPSGLAPSLPSLLASDPSTGGRSSPVASFPALLGPGAASDELLEPELAFVGSARAISQNAVVVRFDIAPGYYLYRDKLDFRILEGEGLRLGPITPPEGMRIVDEFFGETSIFREQVEILVPVLRRAEDPDRLVLALDSQGCADLGVCYPPMTQTVDVVFAATLTDNTADWTARAPADPPPLTGSQTRSPPPLADGFPLTEQDRIAAQLADGRLWLIVLIFFGFGLLLTFTPCVFPMIPILSNIIVGQKNLTTRNAFFISLAFVLAMALTYTLAGVLAGLAGANLQAAFQNPWILGGFVAIFVVLALSMFGFYELQVPSFLQTRLTLLSNRQRGGTLLGAAVMGFLAALIVGPCVTAPLVGALLYISQTGDALLGGIALFSLSMGMGTPLLIIGTSAGRLLPKAGPWMDTIKSVFGVGLLAMGIWLLERILPGAVTLFLWAVLLIVTAIYLGALQSLPPGASGWRSLWKGLGIVLLVYGILLMVGAATGGKDPFRPLAEFRAAATPLTTTVPGSGANSLPRTVTFTMIQDLSDLEREIAAATARQQPVFLDFYADWCVDCVRMERTTFQDPAVIQALQPLHRLKADVTANHAAHRDLLRAFQLFGPPAMLFWDSAGNELRPRRVVGYLNSERFLAHLAQTLDR